MAPTILNSAPVAEQKLHYFRNVHTHTEQIKTVAGEIEDTHIYTYIQILRFFSVKVSGYKLSVVYKKFTLSQNVLYFSS